MELDGNPELIIFGGGERSRDFEEHSLGVFVEPIRSALAGITRVFQMEPLLVDSWGGESECRWSWTD